MKSHHSVDVILNVAQGLLDLKKSGTLPFPLKAVSVPARLPAQRARLFFTLGWVGGWVGGWWVLVLIAY